MTSLADCLLHYMRNSKLWFVVLCTGSLLLPGVQKDLGIVCLPDLITRRDIESIKSFLQFFLLLLRAKFARNLTLSQLPKQCYCCNIFVRV